VTSSSSGRDSAADSAAGPLVGTGATALLLGAALAGLDAGAIGYVLPALRAETGASPLQASWLVSMYVIGTLAGIPAAAVAVRAHGAERVFRLCALLSCAGALLVVLGGQAAVVLGGRLLQGLGQGPLLPVAAAMIAARWPQARQGRMMGAISMAYGIAFLGGMLLVPLLLALGWRSVFLAMLALAGAALACMRGAGSGRDGTAQPGAPAALLSSREMRAVAVLALGTGVGQAAVILFPTLAVLRLSVTPAASGLLMLPLALGGVAATVGVMMALDRLGARRLLAAGGAATLAGVLLAAAGPATHGSLLVGAGLLGLGITGLSGGPLRYAAGRAVAVELQGPAQGAVALLTNVGVLAGSLLFGALAGVGQDERTALEAAMLAACVLMGGSFLAVFALRPHREAEGGGR